MGTPPSRGSSGEGLPFAEEGNLTIKQRPKPAGPAPRETALPVGLDFNLTESDTVKRRPRCREREPLQTALEAFGVVSTDSSSTAPATPQAPSEAPVSAAPTTRPEPSSPAGEGAVNPVSPGNPSQPLTPPGPTLEHTAGTRQPREPELPAPPTALLKVPGAGEMTPGEGPLATAIPPGTSWACLVSAGTAPKPVSVSVASTQLAFSGPKLAARPGPRPVPPPRPESVRPPGPGRTQQRLEQTSSSLAAALRAAEKSISAEEREG